MSASTTSQAKPSVPIALSAEAVDDLIYDARAGDLEALNEDIANLVSQHSCNESQIVASAIDMADESEGGSGSCILHFPAANGNSGMSFQRLDLTCLFTNTAQKSSKLCSKSCHLQTQRSVSRSLTTATTLATRLFTGLRSTRTWNVSRHL